jgi:polysaccharide export outer membrane protein
MRRFRHGVGSHTSGKRSAILYAFFSYSIKAIMNIEAGCRETIRSVGFSLLVAIFALGASGQSRPEASATAAPDASAQAQPPRQPTDDHFVIGNDDMLAINVWNEPDFKQSVPVRSDGKISLPLIGDIQAAGRTPLQLQQDIAAKLKAFITQPDVTVMVMQINSQKFNILGRVLKPGSYPLLTTTTVLDAIAQAGGFQDFAKQKKIYILRRDVSGAQSRIGFNYKDVIAGKHSEQNIKVQPGDTIVVP